VQVDPTKPTLKAPGIMLFKLKYDNPHSNFAFKFTLRRYSVAPQLRVVAATDTKVGRCRLTP